jgi:hypothetical protein
MIDAPCSAEQPLARQFAAIVAVASSCGCCSIAVFSSSTMSGRSDISSPTVALSMREAMLAISVTKEDSSGIFAP